MTDDDLLLLPIEENLDIFVTVYGDVFINGKQYYKYCFNPLSVAFAIARYLAKEESEFDEKK